MELLTVQETAQILKVAPITVRRYIASGRLAAVKIGRGVRVRREAIEGLLTPVAVRPPTPRPVDNPEDDLTVPENEPMVRNGSHRRIAGAFDAGPSEEGPPSPRDDDAETPQELFLLRLAAIGDELAPEGGRSDIASDAYPYPTDDEEDDLTIPEGKPLTRNDSLFRIIGMFDSGPGAPTDVASNKHKYLAEAYADLHEE